MQEDNIGEEEIEEIFEEEDDSDISLTREEFFKALESVSGPDED